MNIDEIIVTNNNLKKELHIALSTMERSDKIFEIKKQIIENQKRCPHVSSQYNWAIVNNKCPYCGFIFSSGGMTNESY